VIEDRDSFLRDGRLVLSPRNLSTALEGLEASGQRQVTWQQRLYGAPLAVPLGITTRSSTQDLVEDLTALAAGRTEIVLLGGRDLAVLDAPAFEHAEHVEVEAVAAEDLHFEDAPEAAPESDSTHPDHIPHSRR